MSVAAWLTILVALAAALAILLTMSSLSSRSAGDADRAPPLLAATV
jgi:hypothetical protein